MPRETKYDLQCRVTRLEQDNENLRARCKALEAEPGVFYSGWRSDERWVARPIPQGLDWSLVEIAHELILCGDWDCREDMVHLQLCTDQFDRLPPGVEALIVRYTYSNTDGINVDKAWPAIKVGE